MVERLDLGFSILSDPDLEAIKTFGIVHEGGMMGKDIARPAVFVFDAQGEVIWKKLPENYRIRVRPEEILEELNAAKAS